MLRRSTTSMLGQTARAALSRPTAPLAIARTAGKKASPAVRSFSSSLGRSSHGESDSALSAKLGSELSYERENATSEPEFLTSFKAAGIWEIEDKAGNDELALHRRFGNEKIKVIFSIADIDNAPEEGEKEDGAEGEAEEGEQTPPSLPIRTAITVSKGAGQGALTIDAVAQDGLFLVDNISLYTDEALALELTSEADWKRRGLYMGPAFDNLDETLQTDFESFLEERGIDSNLALFIPDLAEYKEQKEYTRWLEGVKKFVDA